MNVLMIFINATRIGSFLIFYLFYSGAGCPYSSSSSGSFVPRIALVNEYDDGGAASRGPRLARRVPASDYDARSYCSPGDTPPPNRVDTKNRLEAIRAEMRGKSFDALIIPSSDEHQNEYVAPRDKRVEFVSGFSGSAGTSILSLRDAVLWTDSRYTFQADQELSCSWNILTSTLRSPSPTSWLKSRLPSGSRVGADMRLYGAAAWGEAKMKLLESQITFEDSGPLVDEVWETFGRPPTTNGSIFVHDLQYAGTRWQDKVRVIRQDLKDLEADLLVVTALDEVAWLLNLRGSDFPFNPIFRSYVVLEAEELGSIHLFLADFDPVPEQVEQHLDLHSCREAGMCIKVHPYDSVRSFLVEVTSKDAIKKVLLSKGHPYSDGVSYYIYSAVPEKKRVLHESPVMLRKARKEGPEGASMMEAQLKDSVALVEFLAFLELEIAKGIEWDEISVLTPLRKFRGEQSNFRGDSFEAISAVDSNAALAHYIASNQTKKTITNRSIYLLDSGGQYLEGTTDVTRTIHFGEPTPFQMGAYTRVLQGAIDLASLVFPPGTRDTFVDIVARRPLLDGGLNYGHGTGHGIGQYLGIHEGPTLIAMSDKRSSTFEIGQFFSDEPGYYKKGEFGIRLESILRVVEHPAFKDDRGFPLLRFEVTTLVPFEPKLIDRDLLTFKQCLFLNDYNSKTENIIGKRLLERRKKKAYEWLVSRTQRQDCRHNWELSKSSKNSGSTFLLFPLIPLFIARVL